MKTTEPGIYCLFDKGKQRRRYLVDMPGLCMQTDKEVGYVGTISEILQNASGVTIVMFFSGADLLNERGRSVLALAAHVVRLIKSEEILKKNRIIPMINNIYSVDALETEPALQYRLQTILDLVEKKLSFCSKRLNNDN